MGADTVQSAGRFIRGVVNRIQDSNTMVCKSCGQKNRVTVTTTKANCGACSMPLSLRKTDQEKIEQNEDLLAKITTGIAIPVALALLIWTLLITITAFTGGQAPFFFIDFDGTNVIRGLVWLIVVDPIVLTVAYWIFMLAMLPVAAIILLVSKMKK